MWLPPQVYLAGIRDWLGNNTREVLVLTIDQYAGTSLIEQAFRQAQLDGMAYSPSQYPDYPSSSWPTLDWLIKHGKRLIVLSNNAENALYGTASDPWLLPTYKYAWSTSTSLLSETDFNCEVQEGSQGADKLGILNHMISTPVGMMATARKVNLRESIDKHLRKCSAPINLISVAFSNFGDVVSYSNELNQQ